MGTGLAELSDFIAPSSCVPSEIFNRKLYFSVVQGYMLYTIPPIIRFIVVQFSLSLFLFTYVYNFCSYLCIILFCLLQVLILCIVYLCILCIRRSSLWLLYFNKRVCII